MLVMNEQMTLAILLAISAMFGLLDAFFGPASTSMIPKIVAKRQLQEANAVFQGADQVSFIIGPVLAGLAMETNGVSLSYIIATCLVIMSAFVIFPPFLKEAPVENNKHQSPIKDFKEGLSYVRKSSFLIMSILILITLNFFIFGSLQIAIPLLVDIHGGTPLHLSYMEVSLGTGMLIGTFILSKYTIKSKGKVALFGLIYCLIVFIIFSRLTHLSLLITLVFFIGLCMPFVFIPIFTAVQETTENRLMGRVMSIIFLAMNGFDPISYAIVSGLVSFDVSIHTILLSFGLTGLLIALFILYKAKSFQKAGSQMGE
ncbi:MFS transporter [Cytobacillus purgationiresistens]|nr:MFS transporter [Cytobacillus purgationiresistens]